ncbi:putative serine protease HhoB precursor [Rubripirellula amarantea]|uniref:Putative serine protease HhoB n=1 Tax=Rubripirellula amarantea TaxID=2527999 RepID=A0A5C5WWG1_9BACT|nr:trypsin-like peptidase domain-containing protein [Rubripirellula amarantea]TWT55037.1 putative serine protease HhoB precursor [Rubripirellula amarantea]
MRTIFQFALIALACVGNVSTTVADGPLQLPSIVAEAEQARVEAVNRATPSAVSIFIPGGGGGGSGVLISPEGYALTNFHVTSPAGSFMRCSLANGNVYDAVIVGIDPVGDLAMIQLLGEDGPRNDWAYATMGNSRAAQAGDWCMVIGNPFLLASNLEPTVTWGILSGVNRYQYPSGTLLEYGDCLQTDASINPGNSGGPIYDAQGRVLGIVGRCSFEKRGRVNVGVGYAISINQCKNFLGYLRSGRILDHATLGATVATAPDGGGVRVTNILESSDAYRRGLRYDSEILEIDGRIVSTANDLQNVMATFPSGWRVKVRFRENGKTQETLVRLRSVHLPDELLEKMKGALPPPPPREEPKPEEGEEEDGESEDDPHGHTTVAESGDIPENVQARLIERNGYANYFFNEQEQQSFIESLRKQNPITDADRESPPRSNWVITGITDDAKAEPVKLMITDEKIAMVVGERSLEADGKGDIYDAISARSIGGITAALDGWRRMIADGPKKFGECYYLGTMPLGGERPLRDCMVGIDGEIEVRFLSHPDSQMVEVIEAFADRDEDPAELWITHDIGNTDAVPSTLDLRYGTESFLKIKVTDWTSTLPDKPNDPGKAIAPEGSNEPKNTGAES